MTKREETSCRELCECLRTGEQTVYHVVSGTALDGFLIKDVEKDYLVKLIREFSKLYFDDILESYITSNHFHSLIKVLPAFDFSNEDIKHRFGTYFCEKRCLSPVAPEFDIPQTFLL